MNWLLIPLVPCSTCAHFLMCSFIDKKEKNIIILHKDVLFHPMQLISYSISCTNINFSCSLITSFFFCCTTHASGAHEQTGISDRNKTYCPCRKDGFFLPKLIANLTFLWKLMQYLTPCNYVSHWSVLQPWQPPDCIFLLPFNYLEQLKVFHGDFFSQNSYENACTKTHSVCVLLFSIA